MNFRDLRGTLLALLLHAILFSSLVNLARSLFLLPLFKWWSRSSLGREDRLNLSLVFTVSVSVNWTDWSVDSSHCQEYCSEKGGTVTASRQCYTHLKTLEEKVCTRHDNSTKVVKCRDHCPVSGLFHDLFHLVRWRWKMRVNTSYGPYAKEKSSQLLLPCFHEKGLLRWLRLLLTENKRTL